MKRFYRTVKTKSVKDGWTILLDKNSVKTPGKNNLVLPNLLLAEAVKEEWENQKTVILPLKMPFTKLANTAIDRVKEKRHQIIEELSGYGNSDLLCYRIKSPIELAHRQKKEWQPAIDWIFKTFNIEIQTTTDILYVKQNSEVILKIENLIADFNDFSIAGIQLVTSLSNSIILSLALAKGFFSAEKAFRSALLEELYQVEKWGDDEENTRRREGIKSEFFNAERFIKLAETGV